jgi:hypothetical protein
MRPLNEKEIKSFLERFDSFKESEILSLTILSATEIEITLTAQDRARGFDWIRVTFGFSGVSDARLPQEQHLAYIDMQEGISLFKDENNYAFGLGNYKNSTTLKDSQLYIISQTIKYIEAPF